MIIIQSYLIINCLILGTFELPIYIIIQVLLLTQFMIAEYNYRALFALYIMWKESLFLQLYLSPSFSQGFEIQIQYNDVHIGFPLKEILFYFYSY